MLYDEKGRLQGRILREYEFGKIDLRTFYLSKDDLRKEREFCIITRDFDRRKICDGQLWECVVEREIIDRKGNKVKVVKPVKFLHEHSLGFRRRGEQVEPYFCVVSGYWYEVLPVEQEVRTEEYKDEFIHYIETYPVLKGYCPYCGKEVIRDDFARQRQTLYQASLEEIISYWKEYLGEEYNEVVKMWRELDKKISKVKEEFEKKRDELKNKIHELENVGIVVRKLTQKEREELFYDRYRDWLKFGGDPFEEFEVPEYTYEVVDRDAREKALKEIEELEKMISLNDQLEKEKIEEIEREFYENEKVKRILEKGRYLLTHRVYPCILAKISEWDPYFFEFTSLEMMPTIDAIETVFMACKC
jgi:hypothetical protein